MSSEYLSNVRRLRPMVHTITNYVTANDCANLLLAAGASPIMADAPEETAQIAAMADCHFEIAKSAAEGRTATTIRALGPEESVQELARLLGGAKITDAVLKNAREMKDLADSTK